MCVIKARERKVCFKPMPARQLRRVSLLQRIRNLKSRVYLRCYAMTHHRVRKIKINNLNCIKHYCYYYICDTRRFSYDIIWIINMKNIREYSGYEL